MHWLECGGTVITAGCCYEQLRHALAVYLQMSLGARISLGDDKLSFPFTDYFESW